MNTFKRIIVVIAGVIISSFVISKLFGQEMAPVKHVQTESKSSTVKSSNSQLVVTDDKMTQSDYDSIVIGDSLTGVGGTNLNDVKSKFGEPINTMTSDVSGMKAIIATWHAKGNAGGNVTVTFYEQNDGSYLAAAKVSFVME